MNKKISKKIISFFFNKYLLVICSILMAILLAEITARYTGPQEKLVYSFAEKSAPVKRLRQLESGLYQPFLSGIRELVAENKLIYRVKFAVDKFGRRTMPIASQQKEKNLIFFGCSQLFGRSVNDEQAIPFLIEKMHSSYASFNYAINGGAMHNMYSILNNTSIEAQVPKRETIGVYLYYSYHMPRIGKSAFNAFAEHDYVIDPELKLLKPVSDSYLVSLARKLVDHSVITKNMGRFFEKQSTEADYELAEKLFIESKKKFMEKFPDGRFLVILVGDNKEMNRRLDNLSIENHVVSELDERFTYSPFDAHYNPEGNQIMAHNIAKILDLKKK